MAKLVEIVEFGLHPQMPGLGRWNFWLLYTSYYYSLDLIRLRFRCGDMCERHLGIFNAVQKVHGTQSMSNAFINLAHQIGCLISEQCMHYYKSHPMAH